jgi:hypothetical protein
MAGRVLNINQLLADSKDQLAEVISQKYSEWDNFRQKWLEEKKELRNYLFATDTRKTSNSKLPWKNSTTIPKLTQIRDNLHANYMEAMFPNEHWLQWEGSTADDELETKAKAIESYMRTKLRQDNAEIIISQLVLDYIDYGNCFATAEWVDESTTDETGTVIRGYVGPRIVRFSPYDIVFNPLAPSFEKSPKIIRSIKSLGELYKDLQTMDPNTDEARAYKQALDKSTGIRSKVAGISRGDTLKSDGLQIDGFSSIQHYFGSDYVEILTFYGDLYDIQQQKFLENHIISVIDRCFIIRKEKNPDWTVGPAIFHAGWRIRPDNLYAMGPLDNLVGMQYRMDHLENLKADAFDMIAFPVLKIKGYVENFVYEPGSRIIVGEDGDVVFMHPDVTALNADNQIDVLEQRMEQMAGAPREAMGIRSPGEKTKFEVQKLDNAASRIFNNKIEQFERVFAQKLYNYMLQLARKNMSSNDVTRTLDSQIDAIVFSTITKEDITANGNLRPIGASHFAAQANLLQNIVSLANSPLLQDPAVNRHLSGKKIAKLVERLTDLDEYAIYGENIRVIEEQETARLANVAQERVDVGAITPPGLTTADQPNA